MAPAPVALHRARPLLLRRSSRAAPRRMVPMPMAAQVCRSRRSPLRRRSRHLACSLTAGRSAQQPEQRPAPWPMAPMPALACRSRRSPLRRRSLHSACPLTADRPAHQPGQRRTRPAILSTSSHQSPPRRHIPAAVRRHVWQRDEERCCYRDPLTGRRCTSSHLLQIDHLLPVAQGGGPEPDNLELSCFTHHLMRHGHGPGPPPEAPDVAPPPRCCRAARLRWPTACRWPGGDTLRSSASRACIFATASSDSGRSLSMRSCEALSWSTVNEFLPRRRSHPITQQFSVSESGIDAGQVISEGETKDDLVNRCSIRNYKTRLCSPT